jgi:DNA-3-methyladenine glycosylase I
MTIQRCPWSESDPLMRAYHDEEWGVPLRDSRALWEMLILEGFQAGLSWSIILKRREGFRRAFGSFDPHVIAQYGEEDVARLMADEGIIRARAKIEATISNAGVYLAAQAVGEDFSTFVWTLIGGEPIRSDGVDVPVKTALSEEMSAALKKRGYKFVGPVIVYAWMQACGLVNDHVEGCFRRDAVVAGPTPLPPP